MSSFVGKSPNPKPRPGHVTCPKCGSKSKPASREIGNMTCPRCKNVIKIAKDVQ